MKTKKILLILFLIIIFTFHTNIFASTNTYPRTEEDLKIHSSINVTNAVKKAALSTPKVDASEKIYDFANLFTNSEESNLYSLINNYINKHNMDMIIVTINDNNKSSAMAYADDFYDYNDFGKGTTFDGLLFLIDMDNREMWISTTGKAILMYNDDRINNILDKAYKYISSKKYYDCAKSFISSSSSYASQGIPANNKDYTITDDGDYEKSPKSISDFPLLFAIIIAFILSSISVFISRSKHKTIKKATEANQYLIKNSIKITNNEDKFVNSHVSKIYDPPSSSSSGGGSSTHRSSSGRSHGGGGRRF